MDAGARMISPWLSVLMPTYNGASYLRAALDSVVAQADPEVECIAVDDGSTDETVAILGSYRDRLNLTILDLPRVGNWVKNTNLALERAGGEFSCLLHQDDVWLPGRLRAIKNAVAGNPSVDLFLHPSWFIDSQGRRLGPWRCPLPKAPAVLDAETILPRLLVQNFLAIPAPVFRTAKAREIGGLDEALWYTADWDFWLKLATAGQTVCLPERLSAYRVHPEAQTNRRSIDIPDFQDQQDTVLKRHLPALDMYAAVSRRVRHSAELSIAVNVTLASRRHGINPSWGPLAAAAFRAGPLGVWRYLRDSRIRERVSARLRASRSIRQPRSTLATDAVAE